MLYVNPQTAHSVHQGDMKPGTKTRDAEVLREYEQLFIYQMLKEMRKTVPDYGVVDGPQQEHFHEMMDDFLAGEMARSGQFGIAAQLEAQIALQQSGTRDTSAFDKGIPLRKAATGIPMTEEKASGIPFAPPSRFAIPLPRPEEGIPLVREKGGIAPGREKVVSQYANHAMPRD